MSYDIIGDIHGQAAKLENLLALLGYRRRAGTWRHPSRKAIFVGDFIDRGPRQLDTVDLVRRMVDDGQALAVMGNHEFNARRGSRLRCLMGTRSTTRTATAALASVCAGGIRRRAPTGRPP